MNTMRQPDGRDASASGAVQADQPAETPAPAPTPPPVAAPPPAPITEAPLESTVTPPVNRRPGAPVQTEAVAPPPVQSDFDREAARPTRASRRRAAASLALPAARPLVAGRVEGIYSLGHTVEVQKGDTINSIAGGLMTPRDELIRANRLRKPYELEVGRVLKIPVHKVYVVQAGDTFYGIGRRFSTPVDVLSDINQMDAKARLRPGQKIALPIMARDTGPIARPGESAAELARAEEAAPPRREAPAPVRPSEELASTRTEPYAEPSGPRPYESMSPRPPSRPAYPTYTAPEVAPSVPDSQIQVAGRGRFIWPVRGDVLSTFGAKPGGQRNDGVDIAAPAHSAVHAAASGDVVYAGDQIPGFGNLVLIKHEGGWVTAYAHLSTSEVKIREHVEQGAEIGQVGQTGGVDQPELHFEIRYAPSPHDKARPIDPKLVLSDVSDQ
jgi:murein DD-endopeptidase MepM/ murein hydrolase activator NlpD